MTQPTSIASSRLDQLDADRFRDMVTSPSFALFTARLKDELERSRLVCEREDDPGLVAKAQGAVAALRSVLAMPAIILKEIESKRKR